MTGIERLKERIKKIDAGKILDLASGNGNFVYFIKEFKSNDGIFCVDTNENLSQYYDQEFAHDNIKFLPMDASSLRFRENLFDSVSISNSIHHLKNPKKVFSEMKRVVKENGILIINEMFSDRQDKHRDTHTRLHNWWGRIDTASGNYHGEVLKKDDLIDLLKEEFKGFEMEIIEYYQPFEDPYAPNVLKQMSSYIDVYIKRAKKANLSEELIVEGEEIRDILYNNGYSPSGSLFLILKNKTGKE